MGIDAIKVGIKGVGNLAFAQRTHRILGELQIQAGDQPAAEQEQPDQQAEQNHDCAFDWQHPCHHLP